MTEEYIIPKRGKGRRKATIVTKDFYKYYLSQIKPVESISGGKTLGSYDLTPKEYSNILKDINEGIIRLIILETFEFKLPFGMGRVSMIQKEVKYKLDENGELNTKNLSLDYKATNKLWKEDPEARKNKIKIFHTNTHTNGYRMAYFWSKKGTKCPGLYYYYFLPCRTMKRKPALFLKDPDLNLMFYERISIKSFI